MASQPPKKAYTFDVVVLQGAGRDDVVDGTASVAGKEVYCVQNFGARNFQVAVNSEAAVAQLGDVGDLETRGVCVSILPLSPRDRDVPAVRHPQRGPGPGAVTVRQGPPHH
ncbi:hypothetical protein HPB50_012974 [Hyalomma asiaticum]|uniref:Uncharacterized protein n=1 Tax=Hyalomma asiaticum TaxID=266040 RepID=A0ACB7T441_HYAAI|nr:hypothetical protein HPB50_012974 [Hyalomma asiaticum]